jgi:hypothetical protein
MVVLIGQINEASLGDVSDSWLPFAIVGLST